MENSAEAIQKIVELARDASEPREVVTEDGRHLYLVGGSVKAEVDPAADTWPPEIPVHSLSGVIDYLEENPDELDLEKCVLLVGGPGEVTLASSVVGPARKRSRRFYLVAKAIAPGTDIAGSAHQTPWRDVEQMVIALQSSVQDRLDRETVLKLLGSVKDSDSKEIRDDGVSQSVSVKSGPTLVDVEKVPNPVHLAPFRTFPEIKEQPASPFVLRIRRGRGVEVALFEADGGAWRQEAIDEVRKWLEDARDHVVGPHPKIIG